MDKDKVIFQAEDNISPTINRVAGQFKNLKREFLGARKDIKDVQEAMRGFSTITGGALGGFSATGGGGGGGIDEILKPVAGALIGGMVASAMGEIGKTGSDMARRGRVRFDSLNLKNNWSAPLSVGRGKFSPTYFRSRGLGLQWASPSKTGYKSQLASLTPSHMIAQGGSHSYMKRKFAALKRTKEFEGMKNKDIPISDSDQVIWSAYRTRNLTYDRRNFRKRVQRKSDFWSGKNPMNPSVASLFEPAIGPFIPVDRKGNRMKGLLKNPEYLKRIRTSQRMGRRQPDGGINLLPLLSRGAGFGRGMLSGIGGLARGLGPAALAFMAADMAINFGSRMYDEYQTNVRNPDYKSRYFEGKRISLSGGKFKINGIDSTKFMRENVLYNSYGMNPEGAGSQWWNIGAWANATKEEKFKEQLRTEFNTRLKDFERSFFRMTRE